MTTFTVHEPPGLASSLEERAESLVFVRDGFSWGAMIFGPFYFLMKREWAGLSVFVMAALVMRGLLALFDAGATSLAVGSLVLAIVAGFEANEIQRAWLSLKGWHEIAAVSGRSLVECEHRFFNAWLPSEPHHTPDAWRASPFAREGQLATLARVAERGQSLAKASLFRVRSRLSPKT